MAVTLDVDRTWRVVCDGSACRRRLYLIAESPGLAAAKARDEYAWRADYDGFGGVRRLLCPPCRSEEPS